MNEGDLGGPEERGHEPAWDQKILRLNDELQAHRLPYAFGGAIALNYHREPRSTLDIDINVFVDPGQGQAVLQALQGLYGLEGQERATADLRETGQARTIWGSTFVDLFLANTDFHTSMASRLERQPFGDGEIPVLAIEDLLVCKVLFDRPKDWVDIEAVAKTRHDQLDGEYVQRWLGAFLEPNAPRVLRVAELIGAAGGGAPKH